MIILPLILIIVVAVVVMIVIGSVVIAVNHSTSEGDSPRRHMVGRPPAWRSLWTSAAASRGGCTLTILSIFSSVLSVKLIISKKGGKGQGNRDAPYNIIMFTIMIVTITIIIAGGKRGDGNASLHIRSNVGLSKRSHSFTLNPRETGAHCSILAHICYFVCSWSSRAKPPTCRSSGLSTPGTGLRRTVCFTASASGQLTDSSTHCRWSFTGLFTVFLGMVLIFFIFEIKLYFIFRLLSQWVQK